MTTTPQHDEPTAKPQGTPGARWIKSGEPDPHGNRYDCERAALAAWAQKHGVHFVSRSGGEYTTSTVSRDALAELAASPAAGGVQALTNKRIADLWHVYVGDGAPDAFDIRFFARAVEAEVLAAAASDERPVLTGAVLREIADRLEPLSEMENEVEVIAWWKHYAGHVRNVLAGCSTVAASDEWYCERHPDKPMNHDDCDGAGVPEFARVSQFLHLLRMEKQKTREAEMMRDEMAAHARRLAARAPQAAAGIPDAWRESWPDHAQAQRAAAEGPALTYADLTADESLGWPYGGSAEDKNRHLRDVTEARQKAAPQPTAQAEAVTVWRKAVQEAYGWLWHVNNEPMAPVPLWSPEKAAYEARKNLRELLTMDERGEAINSVRGMLENMAAANSAPAGEGEKR